MSLIFNAFKFYIGKFYFEYCVRMPLKINHKNSSFPFVQISAQF